MKLKMVPNMILTISISALPLYVSFEMSAHFLRLWTLCQKARVRFLISGAFAEICNKRQKRGHFWASYLASIFKEGAIK